MIELSPLDPALVGPLSDGTKPIVLRAMEDGIEQCRCSYRLDDQMRLEILDVWGEDPLGVVSCFELLVKGLCFQMMQLGVEKAVCGNPALFDALGGLGFAENFERFSVKSTKKLQLNLQKYFDTHHC